MSPRPLAKRPIAPWRTIVVEDERLPRFELVTMLREHGGAEIVGEASSLHEARELVAHTLPQLVLLDIQLGAESGFSLLESLPAGCRVIFVTAFDRYAVRAFEVNAVDYLLKPVDGRRLALALARVAAPAPARPVARVPYDGHLFIGSGRAAGFVAVRDVRCLIAEKDYTRVVVAGARESLVLRTLADWELMLPADRFERIHRSAIVNLEHVVRMEALPSGAYEVTVRDLRKPLTMSRRHAARVRASWTGARRGETPS